MKFVADHMLGSLAKWLRFLGFDTAYPNVLEDENLIKISKEENRIILTRDSELCQRTGVHALLIESDDINEQIKQVLRIFKLKIDNSNAMSRCSVCNTVLKLVEKDVVKEKVPELVFNSHKEFWICPLCNKYYWQGSHWKKITDKIKELEKST